MCRAWQDSLFAFVQWAYENGYNESLSIDRIDPNGDYSPENCQWVPLRENIRRRTGVKLTAEQVCELRASLANRKYGDIKRKAEEIGLCAKHLERVLRGCVWKDIGHGT